MKELKERVNNFFMKYHKLCWDRIKNELSKHSNETNAVNRIICIIREENRNCNTDAKNKSVPLKEDALLTHIKKELLSADIEESLKNAARYL